MAIPEDDERWPSRQSPESLEHPLATRERGWCQAIVMQLLDELGLEEFELA
jgi:hypothetical protein